jgi:hypothetical protein
VEEHMKKYIFLTLIAVFFMLDCFVISAADTGIPRGKSAAENLLPDELKSIKIDDYFVESKRSPAGKIENATGYVVVQHKDTNRAYFAVTGDDVYQEDIFYTLKNSRCRIKFSTEDIITMGENSKVVADEIIDDRASQKKNSIISMLKGKAMFYVVRLFKHKTVSATVKTPTAVMGVRGTKFGVEVRKAGEKFADLSDKTIYFAQNGSGSFETVIYGFDGEVEVNSPADGSKNNVGAGETLIVDNNGAGDIERTDPDAANRFIQDTEGGGVTGGTLGADTGTVEGGLTGDTGNNTSEDLAQTLTGTANDQTSNTETPAGGPAGRMGYFTAMLTYIDYLEYKYHDGTFMSDGLQDFNNPEDAFYGSYAYDPNENEMWVNWVNGKLTKINGENGEVDAEYPINVNELGYNSYMRWGYWTQTTPMPIPSSDYLIDNKGYYIYGDNTSNSDMATLNSIDAWWLYSGGVHGTYWTDSGGADMTGTFNAKVNFNSESIQEFNFVNVAGGGHNLFVEGASGSFDGTSHFTLSGGGETGGTVYIDSVENTGDFKANGSFYGPAAQSIGGIWTVGTEGSNAAGIFHGDKQGVTSPPTLPQ